MINLSWMGTGAKDEHHEEKNRVSSYKGYLLKLRRSQNLLAPQWGKRWFSIEGRYLNWYRQENDVSPSGMINLKFVRSITKVDSPGCFTFAISCPDRNLVLRCNTLYEMNNWIRAFHIHADIARGGTGMNIVSDFNEEPLRFQGMSTAKRGGKLRSSLTLEQELDLNLKKLDALEKSVQNPGSLNTSMDDGDESKMEQPVQQSRRKKNSKPYSNHNIYSRGGHEDGSGVEDMCSDSDNNAASDILGKLRAVSTDRNHKRNNDVITVNRNDSTNSIEDISLNNATVVNNKRLLLNNQQQQKEQKEQEQPKATAKTNNATANSRKQFKSEFEEGSGDEFETNSDFEISAGRNSTSGKRRGGDSSATTAQAPASKHRYISKLGYCPSQDSDDADGGTFHYNPNEGRSGRGRERDDSIDEELATTRFNKQKSNQKSAWQG